MARPQVIFLDAVGTLFGVQGSVGEQYAQVAAQFGVILPPEPLNQAFFQCFKAAGSPAFPGCDPADLQAKEFSWWRTLALQTFAQVDALDQFSDFEAFFAALYAHFATAEPWCIYADVLPTLDRWQQLDIPLGILSNFDTRIYDVLHALNLLDYFSSVTLSTETGAAKPDRAIFDRALQKHYCTAESAWHIGDSYAEDYQGATAAGLRGIWLQRKGS